MVLSSIVFLIVLAWGFGFSATFLVKNAANFFERNIMRLGIGIAAFLVVGVLLNLFHIILDWRLFLALALLGPIIYGIKVRKFPSWSFKSLLVKENIYVLLTLILFSFSLYMYASGAFSYPYLENDDPWHHAQSVTYVAQEKTLFAPADYKFKYLDPYPPGYALFMGILAQTNDSLSWTLKFGNALILALGGLFFYFFAKEFTGHRQQALFSTFVLVSLPSFFTHFIWAHTLVVMLAFPALYCLEKMKDDSRWGYPAAISIAGILLTQSSTAFVIAIMLILYFIVRSIYQKSLQKAVLAAEIGGFVLSLLWWYDKAISGLVKHSSKVLASPKYQEIALEASISWWGKLKSYFPYNQGTATRAYTFQDFFKAEPFGMINVHVGWGIVVSILLVLGLIYFFFKYKEYLLPGVDAQQQQYWAPVSVVWLIFTFLGVNSMTFNLPLGLFAFRFWLVLAIPVALLSWLGVKLLLDMNKKFKVNIPAILIIMVLIAGIFFTSTTQKYNQNAKAIWPPGQAWVSNEELQLYLSLKELPPHSRIFSYGGKGAYVLGMDQYSCDWCEGDIALRKNLTAFDASQLHQQLRALKYDYLLFDIGTFRYLTSQGYSEEVAANLTNEKFNELASSGVFVPVKNIPGGGALFSVSR